ncbi:hypothetical protein ACHCAI_003861 [Enterobacter asburiae]
MQPHSLKLDIWIDNVKSNSPENLCARELPLRIIANGKKDTALLGDFQPRVASLVRRIKRCCRTRKPGHSARFIKERPCTHYNSSWPDSR